MGIHQATSSSGEKPLRRDTLILLARSVWPIALVLLLSIVLGMDLILALLIAIVGMLVVHRSEPRQILEIGRSTPLGTVPIIVGAMVFRRVLESSQAVEAVSEASTVLGIPLPVIVFSVPMAAGLLTGLAAAAFAIGFPIVFPPADRT